jgi:glycosyltransferase involved in cell wall biosynthesis
MEASHAGIAPYKSDAAMSMPNKIFEYMAGGLPLVSSIQGELVQILKDRDCGLSYHSDSVDELCRAIRTLKNDEAHRVRMGQNARRLLEDEFSTEKVFQKISAHLQAVANRTVS